MNGALRRPNMKEYAKQDEVLITKHKDGLLIDIHFNAILCDEREAHELVFKLLKQARFKWGDGFLHDTSRAIELML